MPGRLPEWLKVPFPAGPDYVRMKATLQAAGLHTVCQEARCPNIGECFACGTATFLILGGVCTRNCGFCAVESGRPADVDVGEPERVAETVRSLGLKHVVITSVTRDDLRDGGASAFAATVSCIRRLSPGCRVEVLVPDFRGSAKALGQVMAAAPEILGHNVETAPRLYSLVSPQASYRRSLEVLERAANMGRSCLTKSGIMVGLGEKAEEVRQVFADLSNVGCDIVTVGQYLRPSPQHAPVAKYYAPEEFAELKSLAESMGFKYVESGPLVRSSYHAERALPVS